ncbi:protein translocase subunit SecD [Candidatus Omnitrophota bacterium]
MGINKNLRMRLAVILSVLILFSWFAFPLEKRIDLGLDLKGGMHLVLRVDTSKLSEDAKKDAVERALEVIRNRIDEFGVGEPSIQRQGEEEIVVQLPGITDRNRAIELIGKTALLEFKLVNEEPNAVKQALEGNTPEGYELKSLENEDKKEPILLKQEAALIGDAIADAQVSFDRSGFGEPYVSLKFESKAAKEFATLTQQNVGKRLAIVLDGNVYSAPVIREAIPSGEAQISGRFDLDEARDLAIVLRVGALPAPMYIEEERTVGPLLGQDSIKSGIQACVVGGVLVLIFMLAYYLNAGIIANFALVMNLILILGALGMFRVLLPQQQVTLTLPGIAGIVLTLGMAVDANVLINERIREELRIGRPLYAAVRSGYAKAFTAIIDSNVTTLIAAFLLFQFGTGPIRGFAVTLTIGILASLFTAIFVTRTIFETLLATKLLKRISMVGFLTNTKFDFIGKRRILYVVSLIVIIIGIVAFLGKGKEAYGIDFTGGEFQEYRFQNEIPVDQLRESLQQVDLGDSTIVPFKENPRIVMIRTGVESSITVQNMFKEQFPDNSFEILRIEKVGPLVGQELRTRALKAILFALAGIMIYVGFRFKHFNYAAAGIIALFHDVLITIGILAIMNRPIDLLIVTALLTIAGYSINDTIVIFDRVREIERVHRRKATLAEIINLGVNQTLSRTVLTTFLTLLVVFALFFVGGQVLNSFALALIIGFTSGVYSTIFIASPLALAWQRK